jgi:hypothetical protein
MKNPLHLVLLVHLYLHSFSLVAQISVNNLYPFDKIAKDSVLCRAGEHELWARFGKSSTVFFAVNQAENTKDTLEFFRMQPAHNYLHLFNDTMAVFITKSFTTGLGLSIILVFGLNEKGWDLLIRAFLPTEMVLGYVSKGMKLTSYVYELPDINTLVATQYIKEFRTNKKPKTHKGYYRIDTKQKKLSFWKGDDLIFKPH